MKVRFQVLVNMALLFAGTICLAQEPVKPAEDVEALFHDRDPKRNEMKQVAYPY